MSRTETILVSEEKHSWNPTDKTLQSASLQKKDLNFVSVECENGSIPHAAGKLGQAWAPFQCVYVYALQFAVPSCDAAPVLHRSGFNVSGGQIWPD